MSKLQELIDALPEPTIFKTRKIEEIIAENVALLKELNPDYVPVESDANMMQMEALAYKELKLTTKFNNAIKAMLPHYAKDLKDEDLDNFIFGFYGGETRHLGEEPTAPYEFEIEEALGVDIVIPKGFILSDGADATSFLEDEVAIKAGTLKVEGKVKLDEKIKESDVITETVVSPYPYVLKPTSKGKFEGGSSRESNEEFFERAILSLYKYSTAGGEKAYEYFSYKADERVKHVKVLSPSPTVIDVIVKASSSVDETVAAVDAALNDEKTQCFTDQVSVRAARIKAVTLAPTIHLIDMLLQSNTNESINNNFNSSYKIAEGLPYSKIIKALEVANVYKVELAITDLAVKSDEVLEITLNPTFVKAEL